MGSKNKLRGNCKKKNIYLNLQKQFFPIQNISNQGPYGNPPQVLYRHYEMSFYRTMAWWNPVEWKFVEGKTSIKI